MRKESRVVKKVKIALPDDVVELARLWDVNIESAAEQLLMEEKRRFS